MESSTVDPVVMMKIGGESWACSGDEAFGWVNKVKQYFQIKGVLEEERLQAVLVAMEGRFMSWFQWLKVSTVNPSLEGFNTAVIRRF